MDKKGKLFIVSGPSGVGKGTMVQEVINRDDKIKLSVSATTRKPREGEEHGVHYYFLDKEDFKSKINEGAFVEWAEFSGNFYGTFYKTIEDTLLKGKNLILEIEVNGAAQVKEKMPEAKLVFIMPPSFEELKHRLISRGTETKEAVETRLKQVEREIKQSENYDKKIVNNNLEDAIVELMEYIKKESA